MQDHELNAWLGPVAATAEQRDALMRASDDIDARYPDEDAAAEREAAFNAAAMVILGDDTLEAAAAQWRAARAGERAAMAALTGTIIATAQTTTETGISERAQLNRMTVRKALGKQ